MFNEKYFSFDKKLNWSCLSSNSDVMYLLEYNKDKIDYKNIFFNENAFDIIKNNIDKFDFFNLSFNKNCIKFVKELNFDINNIDWFNYSYYCDDEILLSPDIFNQIDWRNLSSNTSKYAIKLLEENPEKIDWINICSNSSAYNIIKNYQSLDGFIDWNSLSQNSNPDVVKILEENLDKINWNNLSKNTGAIHIIKQNLNKVNWKFLSLNSNAISILQQNPDKIDYKSLLHNPNAFYFIDKEMKDKLVIYQYNQKNVLHLFINYNYDIIKNNFYNRFGKELVEYLYHPKNINKWNSECWNIIY